MSKNLFKLKRSLAVLKQSSIYIASEGTRQQSVWTHENIIQSPYKNIEIPSCTINEYVWRNMDKWPNKTAVVCSSTGRGYTYEQAFKLSITFAANLRNKLRIQDGDVVAIVLPNVPEFPLAAMGILEAGGVITTINPIYTAYEVKRQLLMSNAKAIVTLPETLIIIKEALQISQIKIPIIVVETNGNPTPEETICFHELCEDVHVNTSVLKKVRRSSSDICFMPYSSGTTGLPKGVELTHRNLVANKEQLNEPTIVCHKETTSTHQDSVLAILPFFHIFAASVVMFHKMSVGAKLVTITKLQPDHYFDTIEKYKTNLIYAAPPLVLLMGVHKAATPKSLQSIEILLCGAAPLSDSDVERCITKAQKHIDFRNGYGMTETSPTISVTPKGLNSIKHNSTGPPVPNTKIRIVNQEFKNLGPNETGEILVRGPQVMRGYRDNPQANMECFKDGWFRTGDIGMASKEGFITVVDRLKELIKVKGFQVPPAELEAVFREHPSVIDAAVIGVPHPTHGDAPKAFVVLKKGKTCDTKQIEDFVKERVAPYKRVTDITILNAIPRSATGKILRKVLKEDYC